MFAEGIFPIGDGLLDIDEERLKGLLVPHDINEIYDVEQTPFARGKFAAVRRAIHKNSGTHFAAKFLKRRRRAQSSDREIKHEIAVLMLCSEAENIVKLNAVHESRSDTALLLELATGGELQTFLDNEECLNEGQARMCMREVLKALQFLHKRSIVHLDLKPQNILLTGERIEDGLKLCDFGISRVVAEGTNVREIVGTPDYVAPEVLQYEPLSLCTDIWSVGVLTYVLLSGFSPFGGETKQETFLNISQCALTFPDKLFGGVSSAAIDFIRKALRIKPSDRMTAAGCLEHIWLKDECNIDRHIFNKLSTKQQLEQADNNHQEDDNGDDDDNNEQEDEEDIAEVNVNDDDVDNNDDDNRGVEDNEVEIVKDKPQAISVDNSEEEDNITSTSSSNNCLNGHSTSKHYNNHLNGLANGHTNGHSNGLANGHSNGVTNGHSNVVANGHSNVVANGHSNSVATNSHSNSLTNSYSNGFTNAFPLDYSNDFFNGHSNGHSPGHLSCLTKAHSNGFATNKTLSEDFKDKKSSIATATTTTTKTTAVHNVAATKAITIPLCSVQPLSFQQTPPQEQHSQHQQQQLIHIPARRHSSESNKENTFLTTKKIQATSNNNGLNLKKPASSSLNDSVTESSTATIVITPTACTNASNIVATITLPCSASSSSNGGLNEKLINTAHQHSLFPDAPTTPKVIRKASPNSDTSPTSVKALVKKFQLEGGEQPITPPEFATNGSKQQPQHNIQHIIAAAASTLDTKSTHKYNKGRPSLSPPTLAHSSAMTIANTTARRASEPMPAIHTTKKLSIISTSAPVSIPPATTNNFKTTCVYCKSCTNSSSLTNGCRHPSSCTNNSTTTAAVIHNNATKSLSTATTPLSGNSTKSLINNSSSNGSLTSTSSASTNGTTTTNANGTTALLFGQHHNHQHLLNSHHNSHHSHHHHHHHHLHHHGVVKSAATSANGLSLDQGIIC